MYSLSVVVSPTTRSSNQSNIFYQINTIVPKCQANQSPNPCVSPSLGNNAHVCIHSRTHVSTHSSHTRTHLTARCCRRLPTKGPQLPPPPEHNSLLMISRAADGDKHPPTEAPKCGSDGDMVKLMMCSYDSIGAAVRAMTKPSETLSHDTHMGTHQTAEKRARNIIGVAKPAEEMRPYLDRGAAEEQKKKRSPNEAVTRPSPRGLRVVQYDATLTKANDRSSHFTSTSFACLFRLITYTCASQHTLTHAIFSHHIMLGHVNFLLDIAVLASSYRPYHSSILFMCLLKSS